jgi:hypothetical protein
MRITELLSTITTTTIIIITTYLIDVAVYNSHNLYSTITKNLLKYRPTETKEEAEWLILGPTDNTFHDDKELLQYDRCYITRVDQLEMCSFEGSMQRFGRWR